ncbi:MAG: hypothetical protein IPO32_20525 [Crocinitomicaceae bacterium]|nr:hypothetical protein [Crocinitomicaceae bacterium]
MYGEFDQYGTVNFTDGRVAFVGLMEQYIDAGGGSVAFNELEINNTSGFDVSFYDGTHSLKWNLTSKCRKYRTWMRHRATRLLLFQTLLAFMTH